MWSDNLVKVRSSKSFLKLPRKPVLSLVLVNWKEYAILKFSYLHNIYTINYWIKVFYYQFWYINFSSFYKTFGYNFMCKVYYYLLVVVTFSFSCNFQYYKESSNPWIDLMYNSIWIPTLLKIMANTLLIWKYFYQN